MAASPFAFFSTTEVRIRGSKPVNDDLDGKRFYTRLRCLELVIHRGSATCIKGGDV